MPKLHYPAYFENGLIGARCKDDIQHREAFLYVPYKMLLSVKYTQNHEVLGPIILDNPKVFDSEHECDWEQLTLTLAMIYEMTLGTKSYWYPYLRMLPDVGFSCLWDDHEFEMLQDECLVTYLQEYNTELECHWEFFENVLRKYPKIFPEKFIS